MIKEPDVALTDFALAAECAVLGWLMRRGRLPRSGADGWAAAFFGSVGTAALIGGCVHGFFPERDSSMHALLWWTSLVAIGAAAMSAWATGAYWILPAKTARWVACAAAAEFALYVLAVTALGREFGVAIANYLPAMGFMLLSAVLTYRRRRAPQALAGATGIVLTFAATFIQIARIPIHPDFFDHNALYHLIQGIALFLIFRWTRSANQAIRTPDDIPGGVLT